MSVIMRILKGIDWFLANFMKTVIIFVTLMAIGTMFLQVVARYVFQISITGLDELAGHTAVWLYLMGAAYGSYDRSQIKADIVDMLIKNHRILGAARALAAAVSLVVSIYMVVWSFNYVVWSWVKHEVTPALRMPTVIFQMSLLVGAVLMSLYFLVELIDMLRQIRPTQAAAEVE